MNSLLVEYYKNVLLTINQKRTNGKSNIAKPILLLTIIALIDEGYIIGNTIRFDNHLIETYNRLFKQYSDVITPVVYPFYYMRHDAFYAIKGKAERKTPSAKYIHDNIEYAYLDDGLWELLQDESIRNEYRQQIINQYLKDNNNKIS